MEEERRGKPAYNIIAAPEDNRRYEEIQEINLRSSTVLQSAPKSAKQKPE